MFLWFNRTFLVYCLLSTWRYIMLLGYEGVVKTKKMLSCLSLNDLEDANKTLKYNSRSSKQASIVSWYHSDMVFCLGICQFYFLRTSLPCILSRTSEIRCHQVLVNRGVSSHCLTKIHCWFDFFKTGHYN